MTSSSSKRAGSPLQEKLNTLLKYGPIKNVLDKVEDKTGCDRMIVVQCLAGLALLVTLLGDTVGDLVCSLLGSLYPAYFSLHALTTKDNEEQRRWLEYWLLSCGFHCFDFIFGGVLCQILPLYWLVRLVLVVWCIAPVDNNGSRVLYTTCVWPLYDRLIKEVKKAGKDGVEREDGSKEASKDGVESGDGSKKASKDGVESGDGSKKGSKVGVESGDGSEKASKAAVESGDGSKDVGGESEESEDFVETSRDFAEDVRSKVEEANSNIVGGLGNFHDRMDKKID